MKKQLFLMSALALTALTSCGGKGGSGLKVGLICLHDVASTYDKNFIDAFEASCKEAKEKGFINDYRYVTGIEEDQACADTAVELINDGFNVIFSDSFGHDQYMHQVAKDHPNVFFSSATGVEAKDSGLKNFHNAFASIYEGRYLAGVAAAKYLLQSGKIKSADETFKVGYVGAKTYAEVISGYTSWYLGIKSVCKNVQMVVRYTNSWYDENAEKIAAQTLIDTDKCILISQHADSMGAPTACRLAGVPNVSYNMNTVEMDPLCKDTYVAHSRINWKPYYDGVLQLAHGQAIEGEITQNWTGDLETKSVEYNMSDDLLNKENQDYVKSVEKDLKEGKKHVFDTTTFTVNNATKYGFVKGTDFDYDANGKLTMFMADLEPDSKYERDTNIVDATNNLVLESYYRSAPGFDLIIDGITPITQ